MSKKIFIPIISLLGAITICFAICFGVCMSKLNQEESYYEQKCNSFTVQNLNLSKGQIVFIGDSITDLYPLDNYYTDLSLATYNRGIGGDTTDGVLNRMKVSLYDLSPSKIVLMIGINDVNGGRTNEYILSNYNKILNQIKTNLGSAQVFCMSVLPLNTGIEAYFDRDVSALNNQVMELNFGIKQLALDYSYTFVNLFNEVCSANYELRPELTDDFIHLNANGFQIWTDVLKPYLV